MTRFLLGLGLGGALALTAREWICRLLPFQAQNFRGRRLSVCLGAVELLAVATGVVLAVAGLPGGGRRTDGDALLVLAAITAVFVAGLYDDSRPERTRGLLKQIQLLFHGTVTSGIVKLVVIVGAAAVVAVVDRSQGARLLVGIPFMAGSANLSNLLDVAPGRALKYFALAATGLAGAGYRYVLLPVALGAGLALLPYDVRERAMLGDSGSNVLGFIVGIVAFETLGTRAMGIGLTVILGLHVLAETVTLSRVIEATPPLRWFDRLGRLPPDQAKPDSGSTTKDSSPT